MCSKGVSREDAKTQKRERCPLKCQHRDGTRMGEEEKALLMNIESDLHTAAAWDGDQRGSQLQ